MATGTAFTNFLELELLDHVFRNSAYTPPAAVYAALFTAAPGETGGGTEVSGGTYAREAITFGAAADGEVTNSAEVDFGTATANWGTISHVGIFDASSAGNMLAYGALASNKTVNNGDSFSFAIGTLTVALD
jgi:hypothetical protein